MAVIDSRTPGILSVLSSENTDSPIDPVRNFISSVTGIQLKFVRARAQTRPGTRPSLATDWVSVGLDRIETPGTPNIVGKKGVVASATSGYSQVESHQRLHMSAMFYGPNAQRNADVLRDAFALTQNTATLSASGLQLQWFDDSATRLPDFAFEQFCDRYEVKFCAGRKTVRVYGIRDFASAKDFSIITEKQE